MNLARKTRLTLGLATVALWSRTALPARAAVGGGTADTPAVAVDSGSGPEAAGELAGFGAFLEQHSVIEGRLREDPALLQDPAFRRNHPTIARYLARHPEITVQLAARPRWFLHRELAGNSGPPSPARSWPNSTASSINIRRWRSCSSNIRNCCVSLIFSTNIPSCATT